MRTRKGVRRFLTSCLPAVVCDHAQTGQHRISGETVKTRKRTGLLGPEKTCTPTAGTETAMWKPESRIQTPRSNYHLMKNLNRWNPLREAHDLRRRILTAFNQGVSGREQAWAPPSQPLVSIAEDDSEYQIIAELPESSRNKVQITVEDGVLSIKQCQRDGAIVHDFPLPGNGDSRQMEVKFKDGILKVRLDKSGAAA